MSLGKRGWGGVGGGRGKRGGRGRGEGEGRKGLLEHPPKFPRMHSSPLANVRELGTVCVTESFPEPIREESEWQRPPRWGAWEGVILLNPRCRKGVQRL